MKKKLAVRDLRIGMYVSELDRPWTDTPFMFQGFEIRSVEVLEKLRELCQFVYVYEDEHGNPAKPGSAAPAKGTTKAAPHGVAGRAAEAAPKFVPPEIPANGVRSHTCLYEDKTQLEDEIQFASEIESSTRELIFSIIDDVRLGRMIDAEGARRNVAAMTESVVRNPDALVWLTHLKKKHEYTALHSLRVCILALSFGRHLNFTREQLEMLGTGALLHDIGKIKVPPDILDKPERLTEQEYDIMKRHVPWGVEVLDQTKGFPRPAIDVARHHHERYSGIGYYNGLRGDAIGIFGLIAAIVDAYDALTSDRVYRAGVSSAEALKIIYEGRNQAFHPGLVEQFIQCLGIFPLGSVVEMNTGSVGVVITVNRARRLKPRVALVLQPNKQPYSSTTVVDLMHQPRDEHGRILEIKTVLPPGQFGIDPTAYLPHDRRAG